MFLLPSLPGMETPEQRRRKRLVWAGIVLVLALCYPAYLLVVRWRADQLAASSEEMLRNHQSELALATARSALGLRPNSIRAMRTVATVLAQGRRPEALPFWKVIAARPEATITDFESGLDAAVGVRAYDSAQRFVEDGIKRFGDAPTLLRRAASLFETVGDSVQSVQYAQRFLKDHPGDDLINLILQRQILAAGTPSDRVAAKDRILEIAARSPELRLDALKWVAKLDGLPAQDVRKSLNLLSQVSGESVDRLLARADLELKLDPGKLPEVGRAVFEQGQALANGSSQLAELGRWFNNKGQSNAVWFDRTLVLCNQGAKTDRDLFLIRLDALAGLKKWSEIDDLLSWEKPPIEPVLVNLYRIRTRKELGGGSMEDLWRELERNLLREPEATYYVGQYLEKIGESARLERLYRAVVQVAPHTLAAYAGLVHFAEIRGNLNELMAILKEASEKDPGNNLYQNDYAYLSLLTGQNLTAAAMTAESLTKAHPENVGFRITLALAKLTQGDTNAAFEVLKARPLNWTQLVPGQQAVVASVEGAHGDKKDAATLAGNIELNRLKPPEINLLKRWVAGK